MVAKTFSYDDFLQFTPVSRETYSRLQEYASLLEKWQKKINLIGKITIQDLWIRHIIDSSQLVSYIEPSEKLIDLGSGAGFPGLVVAIMGKKHTTLVESDGRKAAFLKEAARVTETEVEIKHIRAETIDLTQYSTVSARALAPLAVLLGIVGKTLKASHKLLLLKGKKYMAEISEAHKGWAFDYETHPSVTDPDGVILSMRNFKPASAL